MAPASSKAKKTLTKKTCQKKNNTVKKYFPTKKNFQGFPQHLCVFNNSLQDYVYVSKRYTDDVHPGPTSTFCSDCLLAPCLGESHYAQIKERARDCILSTGCTALVAIRKCETFMKAQMRRYFNPAYTRERGLPNCVYGVIGDLVPHYVSIHAAANSSSRYAEEDSSSESEGENEYSSSESESGCTLDEGRRHESGCILGEGKTEDLSNHGNDGASIMDSDSGSDSDSQLDSDSELESDSEFDSESYLELTLADLKDEAMARRRACKAAKNIAGVQNETPGNTEPEEEESDQEFEFE